jgi:mono/diheme cytochrome c family protein
MQKTAWLVIFIGTVAVLICANRALAQDSKTIYGQKCARCHADDGSGHTPAASKMKMPDLRSKRIRDMSDADLYNTIAQGTQHRDYPHAFLYTGLTEEQIRGVVKYVRALGSVNQQKPR